MLISNKAKKSPHHEDEASFLSLAAASRKRFSVRQKTPRETEESLRKLRTCQATSRANIHLLSIIGLRCQVPYPSWWHRPWKKGANGPSLPVSLIFIISSQSRLKMYNLVGLVRSEVGEMTNDLISQTQVSQVRKLAETRYFRLVSFQMNKLSPEEEKKLKLEQEKR